jgi:hypothetical protein
MTTPIQSNHVIPAEKIWERRPEGIIFTPTGVTPEKISLDQEFPAPDWEDL